MQKTTSLFQVFDVTPFVKVEDALVVRPPQSMRVFRCTIFVNSQLATNITAGVYIANYAGFNPLSSIYLSNEFSAETGTQVAPGVDTTTGRNFVNSIVLDRRGVGYMADTFYIIDAFGGSGSTQICFIWEGEID
jgi:hypothetical protein